MPLTRFVKVGNISNLSDARYCAGMGVDMLGFRVIPGSANSIGVKQFQEVRGWITGPKIVAELYGIDSSADLEAILDGYRPDHLEVSLNELPFVAGSTLPLIISLSAEEIGSFESLSAGKNISHILLSDLNKAAVIKAPVSVLIQVSTLTALENIPDGYGIALNGTPEIRPGLKSYDELADVLEKLDAY